MNQRTLQSLSPPVLYKAAIAFLWLFAQPSPASHWVTSGVYRAKFGKICQPAIAYLPLYSPAYRTHSAPILPSPTLYGIKGEWRADERTILSKRMKIPLMGSACFVINKRAWSVILKGVCLLKQFFYGRKKIPWEEHSIDNSRTIFGTTIASFVTEIFHECCPCLKKLWSGQGNPA